MDYTAIFILPGLSYSTSWLLTEWYMIAKKVLMRNSYFEQHLFYCHFLPHYNCAKSRFRSLVQPQMCALHKPVPVCKVVRKGQLSKKAKLHRRNKIIVILRWKITLWARLLVSVVKFTLVSARFTANSFQLSERLAKPLWPWHSFSDSIFVNYTSNHHFAFYFPES